MSFASRFRRFDVFEVRTLLASVFLLAAMVSTTRIASAQDFIW